jgi:hypothetical protein
MKYNDIQSSASMFDVVKPVYSGHLGEIDKMTTIYRWPLYEGVWLFDEIFYISCKHFLGCGRGEGCWSYPDNEHSLKKTWDSIDDFENNVSSSTSCYWKLYFCLISFFIYLYVLLLSNLFCNISGFFVHLRKILNFQNHFRYYFENEFTIIQKFYTGNY